MIAYENDNLVIPKRYKNMSVSQLEKEKTKILKKLLEEKKPEKKAKTNNSRIIFNF